MESVGGSPRETTRHTQILIDENAIPFRGEAGIARLPSLVIGALEGSDCQYKKSPLKGGKIA